ncbi:hypothetical protein D3C84_1171360 [compost metagenome]
MPIDDTPHNRQAQAVTTGSAGTAVIEPGEGRKDTVPDTFRYAWPVVFNIDPATLHTELIAEADL